MVRRHVLRWQHQEQLGFLCVLSKVIEGRRHIKESLDARAAAVLPGRQHGRWTGALDAALLDALQAPLYGYEYETTRRLSPSCCGLCATRQTGKARARRAHHSGTSGGQRRRGWWEGSEDATILEYDCGRCRHFVIGAWEWASGEADFLESTALAERLEPALGGSAA